MTTLAILTVSDTRTLETDGSGQLIKEMAQEAGLVVTDRLIVRDEQLEICKAFESLSADVIITNGGTGIAKRDVTFEALSRLITTEILGFGDIFRQLSYEAIGTRALASRAFAFFDTKDQLVFCLPGAPPACALAMEKLILPEREHLLKERRK